MSYKSPLERLYEQPARQDHRYNPYNRKDGQGSSGHSNHHHSNQSSSTRQRPGPSTGARYSDRYRPTQYPRELTDQFEASTCKLCGIDFSSSIVGKMHYSGKPHAKKIKHFLTEWSQRTGLPMPEVGSTTTSTGESLADYCDLCDVRFLSLNDKLIHYSGRQHRKNEMDPNNAKKKKHTYDTYELDDRFGIGKSFCKEEAKDALAESSELECKLCDVRAVNKEQLQIHLTGKKHKEKLAKRESGAVDKKPERKFVCDICNVALETYSLYKLHIDGKRHQKAITKKELEGGADRCEICHVAFSSIHGYNDHVQGKKHEKMLERVRLNTILQDKKISVTCKYCPFVGDLEGHQCDQSLLKIDFQNLDTNFMCPPCNQFFTKEEDYNEHKESRRHLLCVLNQETGDKIMEEFKHFYCLVCKVQYKNSKDYTNHLFEDKHKTLSAPALEGNHELYRCLVCDIVIDIHLKNSHLRDIAHLRNEQNKDTKEYLTFLANDTRPASEYHCENCFKTFDNFVRYSDHLLGEEHVNSVIAKKLQ